MWGDPVSCLAVGHLAFLGGTGPEGLGLALRFAAAGEHVTIGSRIAARAAEAADKIRALLPGAVVDGLDNMAALAASERVVLTLPVPGLPPFLAAAHDALAAKLVIDVMVPVALREGFWELLPLSGAASVGELIQQAAPTARVVSAFKHLPAKRLQNLAQRLEGDVILCGNEPAARAEVAALIRMLPGLRAVDAGGIANGRYLEAVTALLLNLNRVYRAATTLTIVGLPPGR
jgi:hypothetical protein